MDTYEDMYSSIRRSYISAYLAACYDKLVCYVLLMP